MTEFRYVIQHKDGACLYLSENGPTPQPNEFLTQLRNEGFQYADERQLGESKLCILRKDTYTGTTTGVIVSTDPYTGKKRMS
jgi:hypothetical protein